MSFERLDVVKLDESGEIQRQLAVLAGHVAVLRANDPTELEQYRAALAGRSVAGARFSCLVDGTDLFHVGYLRIASDDSPLLGNLSVNEYLKRQGAPRAEIAKLLLTCGIGGQGEKLCGDLSGPQQRAVALLGCTVLEEPRVLVLDEPFEGIGSDLLETLAEAVSSFAWRTKSIVLITKLSQRPKVWVDNPVIVRLQLERSRQATIGVTGGAMPAQYAEALARIRNEQAAPTTDLTSVPRRSRLGMTAGATAALGALIIALVMWPKTEQSGGPVTEAPLETALDRAVDGSPGVSSGPNAMVAHTAPTAAARPLPPLLQGLPHEIASEIQMAFVSPELLLKAGRDGVRAGDAPRSSNADGSKIDALLDSVRKRSLSTF